MNPRVSPEDSAWGITEVLVYSTAHVHFRFGLDRTLQLRHNVSLLFSQCTTWQTYLLTSRLLPLQLLFIRLTYLLVTTTDGVCATFTRLLVILDVYSNLLYIVSRRIQSRTCIANSSLLHVYEPRQEIVDDRVYF